MKPGRELDALIAEKVMGLITDLDRQTVWDVYEKPGYPLPHYSTDIASAWLVVEKLDLHLELLTYKKKSKTEWCAIFDIDDEGWGATAPHAICLAALKAVE